ncbi:hypothetical protein TWF730_000946 [Orbilia blumenaviensis]|uniref:MYND-type domain-containing protein n=1 Tax=Orbilia blumenaviensis TaxID=1796055 RepID=A0AAV9VN63_9PEZI
MLLPTLFDAHGFYYPIGNTPAINLLGHLSPEIDAEVLLLGCGDVRNILFTIFTESSEAPNSVKRNYHFTCCDIEGAVIARNILLLAMILKGAETETLWPIYYDLFMPERCSETLEIHLKDLLSISADIELWIKSDVGKILSIGSKQTLTTVRRFWTAWMESLQNKDVIEQMRGFYKRELARVFKLRFGGGFVAGSARSGGPLIASTLLASGAHFSHYWKTGTAGVNPEKVSMPNPTFAFSKYGRKFSFHYGTDPLHGFHLSMAIVPFPSRNDYYQNFKPMRQAEDFAPLVSSSKKEFGLWCQSFREAQRVTKCTICFFVDDAIEMCGSFGLEASPSSFPVGMKKIIEANKIPKEYFFNHPIQFNVIDISNLIDHLGTYNILLSVLPLLRKGPLSYLHTETLLDQEFDSSNGEDGLYKVLGIEPASFSTLFGIVPVDFLCGQTTTSQVGEVLFELMNSSGNKQRHGRLVWKWLYPFQPEGINAYDASKINWPKFAYEIDGMIAILTAVYKKMFETEDASLALRTLMSGSGTKLKSLQYNTRATFSLLLYRIRQCTSRTVDWGVFMEKLSPYIFHGSLVANCYFQEHIALNYLHGVDTVECLEEDPAAVAVEYQGGVNTLSVRKGVHEALTCVTLSVPMKAFQSLMAKDPTKTGSPQFQIAFFSSLSVNLFGSLRRRFGHLRPADTTYYSGITVQRTFPVFDESTEYWEGKSDVLFSCMVPTWTLLFKGLKISLDIVSTPGTVQLIGEFGINLRVFETTLDDTKRVRLSLNFPLPGSVNEVPNSPNLASERGITGGKTGLGEGGVSMKAEPGESDLEYYHKLLISTGPRAKVTRIIYRWGVESDQNLVKLLEDKAEISTKKLGTSIFNIHLGPESKQVTFPYLVQEATKVSIARKSKYIELNALIYHGMNTPMYLHFPVGIADASLRSIYAWSLHRINLDKSPAILINFKKHKKKEYEWINTVLSLSWSKHERVGVESCGSNELYTGDVLAEMKQSIHAIIMHHTGIQGQQCSFFSLTAPVGGGYMLIFVKDIRMDLSGHGVIADCAIIPLEHHIMHRIAPLIGKMQGEYPPVCVKNSAKEVQAWLQICVSLVERCRTWKHKPGCEYIKTGKVPLSAPDLDVGFSPICACGKGIFPKQFHDDPRIGPWVPYATRAAIGPLFPPPYSKQLQTFDGLTEKMEEELNISENRTLKSGMCAVCGKKGGADQALMKCSACKKIEYCSKNCQKKDWKYHKGSCRK